MNLLHISDLVGRVEEHSVEEHGVVSLPSAEGTPTWPLATAAQSGDWVRFRVQEGRAHIVELLADRNSPLAQLHELAAARKLTPFHSAAVAKETAALLRQPGIDDPTLVDRTALPFITIDEEHSKDLDQALFVEPRARNQGYRVWYAIADAAHFVTAGSALFTESLTRGSTFYLPGLVLPMLPRELSEDLISLNPGVDRRALLFRIDLGIRGQVEQFHIERARVRSQLKTSYDAVQAYYDGQQDVPSGSSEVAASLHALRQAGESRLTLADQRDQLKLRRREIQVSLDQQEGMGFVAMADARNDTERFNEQISLLCNIEGARFLERGQDDSRLQPIFRFHDPPDNYKLRTLARQIKALVKVHGEPNGLRPWDRQQESLPTYLNGLPEDGRAGRLARAIHRQAMLTGGRSGFDATPGIHHGVGADAYARFTAPMREVVGIYVHKETWERLGLATPEDAAQDIALREQVVSAANRGRQLQRELDREINRLVIDQVFGKDLTKDSQHRPQRVGTVMGISRSKVHVQLEDPPIDVKVYQHHLEESTGQRFRTDRNRVSLRSQNNETWCSIGDEVTLQVRGRDAQLDRWQLDLRPSAPS